MKAEIRKTQEIEIFISMQQKELEKLIEVLRFVTLQELGYSSMARQVCGDLSLVLDRARMLAS